MKIMEDSCTGDTGYDGSPLDFSTPLACEFYMHMMCVTIKEKEKKEKKRRKKKKEKKKEKLNYGVF